MKAFSFIVLFCILAGPASFLEAQVPQIINYQGRILTGTTNFNGSGQFKFALVNTDGSVTYWSNDGTSTQGSQPTAAIALTVTNGLYSVLLGDTTVTNMSTVPATVFNNSDVRLRVWFNDGTNGFQLLKPDQRIAAVGYALVANTAQNVAAERSAIEFIGRNRHTRFELSLQPDPGFRPNSQQCREYDRERRFCGTDRRDRSWFECSS